MDLDHTIRLDIIRNAMNELEKAGPEEVEALIDKIFSENSETKNEMQKFFDKIEEYPLPKFLLSMQSKYEKIPKELQDFDPNYYLLVIEDMNNESTNNFDSVLKPKFTKLFEEANLK